MAQALARQFYDLNDHLLAGGSRERAMQRLVELAVAAVPGCAWAGVTTYTPSKGAKGLASSDPISVTVDEIQHELDEGPCVTAAVIDSFASVQVEDIDKESRWPRFCALVAERTPVRSIMSFHLTGDQAPARSALNLYGPEPQVFTGESFDVGALFATHAGALMLHSYSAHQVTNLNAALTSSREIGMAIGILMAMHRITSEEAFEMLSVASQHLNRKLRDVADDVARTGTLPGRC